MPRAPADPSSAIASWSDRLRDLSAVGLRYATDPYDRERYLALRDMALDMLALATCTPLEQLEPLKGTVFARPGPIVAGAGAVIDDAGKVLLMRRSDDGLWSLPGGLLEVGETPAEGVEREVLEETGYRCRAVALSGVYDTRHWEERAPHHAYKFTFLCRLLNAEPGAASHAQETSEIGWFPVAVLPEGMSEGHAQRVRDAFDVQRGLGSAYFDVSV